MLGVQVENEAAFPCEHVRVDSRQILQFHNIHNDIILPFIIRSMFKIHLTVGMRHAVAKYTRRTQYSAEQKRKQLELG